MQYQHSGGTRSLEAVQDQEFSIAPASTHDIACKPLPCVFAPLGLLPHMRREHWLSLGLKRTAQRVFEASTLRTIEAARTAVVGIPKHGTGHHVLGTGSCNEEAVVIATMLRLFNPN